MRVLIVLALLGAAIAALRNPQRIVGGSPTTVLQYPYMVNMQYCYPSTGVCFQDCGGSLITSRVVLSTAQCYYGGNPSTWRAVVGSSFVSSNGSVHDVSSIIYHEEFNNADLNNDVALLKLSSRVVFSDLVKPASIAGRDYNLPDGTVVTTLGWGSRGAESDDYPEQLERAEVNLINQELCAERYAYLQTQPDLQEYPDVTDGMICAGILDVGGKGPCKGDQGGPLIHEGQYGHVIVGMNGWGFGCAEPVYPMVHTRVSYYSDWIVKNTPQ